FDSRSVGLQSLSHSHDRHTVFGASPDRSCSRERNGCRRCSNGQTKAMEWRLRCGVSRNCHIVACHFFGARCALGGHRIRPTIRAANLYPEANLTKVVFRGEGINSSVIIADRAGLRQFYVSGKAEASSAPADMRLERMMGHVPALLHPNPRSVLTVGFGAGV